MYRLIILTIICFFISLAPLIAHHPFQQADIAILEYINLHRIKSLDTFFVIVTDSVTWVCIGLLLLLVSIKSFRKYLPYFIISFLVSVVFSSLLKYGIHRPRPFVTYSFIEKLSVGGSPSFPSGHTTDAFWLAAAICFVSRKWYLRILIFTWAILVAYSRIRLGVHYPSDVLAGIATGSLAAILCYRVQLLQLFSHPPSQQAGQYQ